MNDLDLVSETVDRIIASGFDPKTAPREHRVCVLLATAQGIIDNGGFEYFFEMPFDGDPNMAHFALAYGDVGAFSSAAAFLEAMKRSESASPDYAELNQVLWAESESNFSLLEQYIQREMPGGDKEDGLSALSAALTVGNVPNELFHDCVIVSLPVGQGRVEIKHCGGDKRSASLTRGDEHYNLVECAGEFDCAPEEAVALLRSRLAKLGVMI